MAADPEALAQLARLLDDAVLRTATMDEARSAASNGIERLAEGLATEAAASDDVYDRESAMAFVEARLRYFDGLLDGALKARLLQAVQDKIEAW